MNVAPLQDNRRGRRRIYAFHDLTTLFYKEDNWWRWGRRRLGVRQQNRSKLKERADESDQGFNSEVQLELHLERDGRLLSRHVAGYNHTKNSAGWITNRDWPWLRMASACKTSEDIVSAVIKKWWRPTVLLLFAYQLIWLNLTKNFSSDRFLDKTNPMLLISLPLLIPAVFNKIINVGKLIGRCESSLKLNCWKLLIYFSLTKLID